MTSLPPPGQPQLPAHIPWPEETRRWWEALSTDGCTRTAEDWDYALETALVHADVWGGNVGRTRELRSRIDRIKRQKPAIPTRLTKRAWTAAEDRQVTELHAAGLSLHAIAKKMGRPKSVVSTHAADLGLNWDRSGTAAATLAVQIDNRARRAMVISRMYDRIEHLQDRLEAPTFRAVLRGIDGDAPTDLDFVPTTDERNLADTIARYAVTAGRMEAADASATAEGVRNLLTGIARQIGLTDDTDQT